MPERFRIIGAARRAGRGRGVPGVGPGVGPGIGAQDPRRRGLGALRRLAALRRGRRRLRSAGRGDLRGAGRTRRGRRRPLLPLASPRRGGGHGRADRLAWARRPRPGPDREAVRHRSRLGPQAERAAAPGLRRAQHLPDRPLPRPRGGAEPAGPALRQRDVRAGLESQPHRPHPDRHPGDALDRDARQLLRGDRRLPRHGRHPSLPGPRLRRDGAADLAGPETAGDRAREGVRLDDPAVPGRRRPRPVRRLPRGGGSRRRLARPRPSSPSKR